MFGKIELFVNASRTHKPRMPSISFAAFSPHFHSVFMEPQIKRLDLFCTQDAGGNHVSQYAVKEPYMFNV